MKWKREEGKSPFLKGCWAGFSDLPPHLSRLATGIELCWLGPPGYKPEQLCMGCG